MTSSFPPGPSDGDKHTHTNGVEYVYDDERGWIALTNRGDGGSIDGSLYVLKPYKPHLADTASDLPTAGDVEEGELAYNIENMELLIRGGGAWWQTATDYKEDITNIFTELESLETGLSDNLVTINNLDASKVNVSGDTLTGKLQFKVGGNSNYALQILNYADADLCWHIWNPGGSGDAIKYVGNNDSPHWFQCYDTNNSNIRTIAKFEYGGSYLSGVSSDVTYSATDAHYLKGHTRVSNINGTNIVDVQPNGASPHINIQDDTGKLRLKINPSDGNVLDVYEHVRICGRMKLKASPTDISAGNCVEMGNDIGVKITDKDLKCLDIDSNIVFRVQPSGIISAKTGWQPTEDNHLVTKAYASYAHLNPPPGRLFVNQSHGSLGTGEFDIYDQSGSTWLMINEYDARGVHWWNGPTGEIMTGVSTPFAIRSWAAASEHTTMKMGLVSQVELYGDGIICKLSYNKGTGSVTIGSNYWVTIGGIL